MLGLLKTVALCFWRLRTVASWKLGVLYSNACACFKFVFGLLSSRGFEISWFKVDNFSTFKIGITRRLRLGAFEIKKLLSEDVFTDWFLRLCLAKKSLLASSLPSVIEELRDFKSLEGILEELSLFSKKSSYLILLILNGLVRATLEVLFLITIGDFL